MRFVERLVVNAGRSVGDTQPFIGADSAVAIVLALIGSPLVQG